MSYTKTDFQEFLALHWPFDRLPAEAQERLAQKLQPLRYRMGQPVFVRDRMPSQIALLYEGKARLLGYDPIDKMPATLEVIAPGSMLGWASLARDVPCETAIAADESIFLTLPAEEFRTLCRSYPDFGNALKERCSVAEAYELLGQELARQPQGGVDLRNLAQAVAENAEIVTIPSGENVRSVPAKRPSPQAARTAVVDFQSGLGRYGSGCVPRSRSLRCPRR